jgi:hypothetical protein
MPAASQLSVVCLLGKKEITSEEEERKRAKEMIRDSIHLTKVQPPLKEVKKKKRWWQIWR